MGIWFVWRVDIFIVSHLTWPPDKHSMNHEAHDYSLVSLDPTPTNPTPLKHHLSDLPVVTRFGGLVLSSLFKGQVKWLSLSMISSGHLEAAGNLFHIFKHKIWTPRTGRFPNQDVLRSKPPQIYSCLAFLLFERGSRYIYLQTSLTSKHPRSPTGCWFVVWISRGEFYDKTDLKKKTDVQHPSRSTKRSQCLYVISHPKIAWSSDMPRWNMEKMNEWRDVRWQWPLPEKKNEGMLQIAAKS